ncbi:MAG: proline--tRNA ligase [Acidobacteriia bacterium]|nr:proline--tRNA ligase [Terriglobia bacterium]
MHRWSELFIPTLREAPADAEVASHKLLVRAGYIRQLGAGIYSFLFLGNRTILKIMKIVRQEMDKIGQEFYLPALHPREIWEESGRWTLMGENMFRLKDRKGADLCLGMTHEEIMTDIARKELRSYKQLPQIWYQIQTKFRDEPRPKSGLLRVRQFIMKDSYSFDIDASELDISYLKHYDAYCRIFDRCGLKYMVVEAHSGAMGGSQSHEFMVRTPAGEDLIVSCEKCNYAANMEKATSKPDDVEDLPTTVDQEELVYTPGLKTIDEVAKYLKVSPKHLIKALAFVSTLKAAGKEQKTPVVVFLRGDQTLNEAKSSSIFPPGEVRPMTEQEIVEVFGCPPGFIGPDRGLPWRKLGGERLQVYLDNSLLGRTNLIAGANKTDYHKRNVTLFGEGTSMWGELGKWDEFVSKTSIDTRTEDILAPKQPEYRDVRSVNAGEDCPNCGAPLRIDTAVEIGHIFKLGYKYSESMGARVLDRHGKEVAPIMGSYGIGIERILTAAIEQSNDENGFWLPPSIAPFEVVVVATNTSNDQIRRTAEDITRQLEAAGFDVLLDDRDERPGVKFKDADLVGMPFRVNVGKKVTEGMVEVVQRSTRQSTDVKISDVVEYFKGLLPPLG